MRSLRISRPSPRDVAHPGIPSRSTPVTHVARTTPIIGGNCHASSHPACPRQIASSPAPAHTVRFPLRRHLTLLRLFPSPSSSRHTS
jgi:hypothetical protein